MAAHSHRVTVVRAAGRGSGYLLAPRLVLTAAHVVAGRDQAWVQLADGRPATSCSVAWRRADPPWDAALLEADDDLAGLAPPVRWGHAVTDRPRRDCQVMGFPHVDVTGPSAKPNLYQGIGTYSPGPEFTADRYALLMDRAPAAGGSPWAGMSGAALWSGDLLLGVVVVDRADWAHGRLDAVPSYVLLADAGFCEVVSRHCGQQPVLEAADLAALAEPAQPRRAFRSLSALLHPDAESVRFRGREDELADLAAWCDRDVPGIRVRTLTGPGGAGKSRLARELVNRLRAAYWTGVHLARSVAEGEYRVLAEAHRPLLVVVDYAETRADLAHLLGALDSGPRSAPVRLLLLCRVAGEWLDRLKAESVAAGDLLSGLVPTPVPPLAEEVADRERAYDEAVADLAARLGHIEGLPPADWARAAGAVTRPDLSGPQFSSALTLHMSALAALLAVPPQTAPPAGLSVEAQLLMHEQRYWTKSASRHRALRSLGDDTLASSVAAATLVTPVTRARADVLLALMPSLADQTRDVRGEAAVWLHDLYPAPVGGYCGSLQPDRLGEYHIAECVRRDENLMTILPDLDAAEQVQALAVLARAAEHPAHREHLRQALLSVLTRYPVPLAGAAVTAVSQVSDAAPLLDALTAVTDTVSDPRILAELHDRAPNSSLRLAPWLDNLTAALVKLHRVPAGEDLGSRRLLAISLNNSSNRLADLGQLDDALSANEEAVTIFRALAEAQPAVYLTDLAQALSGQAAHLGMAGRRDQALTAIEEAVGILLVPGAVAPSRLLALARALGAYSTALSDLGRHEESLDKIEQSVMIYRELARVRADLFLPDLARALNHQAVRLLEMERSQQSVDVIEEALAIRRHLASERPDEFVPDLAMSLLNHAHFLMKLRRPGDGLIMAEESVDLYRDLVAVRPEVFRPALSMALNNLSGFLVALERPADALAAVDEAISIRRQLAAGRPDAILPDLAMSLRNRASCLARLGRDVEALAAIEEAVEIRRRLAAAWPGAFLPVLAESLVALSARQSALGRESAALAAADEADGIYRQLASGA